MRRICLITLTVITLIAVLPKTINGGISKFSLNDVLSAWYCAPSTIQIAEAAILHQETGNGRVMVTEQSRKEGSEGILQIRVGMVDHINDIVGYRKYTYNDRFDPGKSKSMFRDFQSHYNPKGDVDIACHIWNAGQNRVKGRWHLTEDYRASVNAYINKVLKY